jgi:predicted Zn finger-like uncharacterized protein
VIVTCERCDTRFQLDDARVPETGARVRCSRCKHAFLVLPPDASPEETLHAVAAAAAEAGEPTPPGVTDDLREPLPPLLQAGAESAAADGESEWQFADDQPPARPRKPSVVEDLWEGVLDEEKPPEARELDALGSPDSWSFVSEEAPPLRPPHAPAVTPSGASAPARVALGRIGHARPSEPAATEAVAEAPPPAPTHALERVGWALTGLLLLAIIHGIAWTGGAPPAPTRMLPLRDGLVVEDLSLRRLENLVAGPVLVVAGAVANPGSAPAGGPARLVARVVGSRRSVEAEARSPRSPEAVREAPPESTADGRSALLAGPLGPGERMRFEAVIAHPPGGEALLELRLEPALLEAGSEAAGPATGGPSPPTPLPSSG